MSNSLAISMNLEIIGVCRVRWSVNANDKNRSVEMRASTKCVSTADDLYSIFHLCQIGDPQKTIYIIVIEREPELFLSSDCGLT